MTPEPPRDYTDVAPDQAKRCETCWFAEFSCEWASWICEVGGVVQFHVLVSATGGCPRHLDRAKAKARLRRQL